MSSETLANIGGIVSVRGSVVDVHVEKNLPPINSLLQSGQEGEVVIEVWAQLSAQTIRGFAPVSNKPNLRQSLSFNKSLCCWR